MREKKTNILNEPDKGVEAARGLLARLFRQILFDNKFNAIKWSQHMERYLNDPANGIPRNVRSRSTARGNLNKELLQPAMTWKVFHDKALRFLNPVRVRFSIQLFWDGGRMTEHVINLTPRSHSVSDTELEDDKNAE